MDDNERLENFIEQNLQARGVDGDKAAAHIAQLRRRHDEQANRRWSEENRAANIEFAQAIGRIAVDTTRPLTGLEVVHQASGALEQECWRSGTTLDLLAAELRPGERFTAITLDHVVVSDGTTARTIERKQLQERSRPQMIDPQKWAAQFSSEDADVEQLRRARDDARRNW